MLLLGFLFGGEAFSYVRTGVDRTRQAVKDGLSLDFQIDRARRMIKDLDPEVAKNMHVIAKEEVQVDTLLKQREELGAKLAKSESDCKRLSNDLKRGDSTFVYCGKSYTARAVETDLANRFNRHKSMQSTAEKLDQIIAARRRGLAAAQEKLKAMQAARSQLDVDVANLEARLEMVRVAQTSSQFDFDDSSLARTRELVSDISTRIDVSEKLVNASADVTGSIDLEEKVETNIAEEVTRFFHGDSGTEVVKLD